MTDLDRTKYLRDLRRKMAESFDLAEIKTLAFDLSVDWDYLSGDEKLTKIQSLIMHLARRGNLDYLVTLLEEERPKVDWPEIPPATQQIQDEGDIIPDGMREAALQDYLDKMNHFVVGKRLSDHDEEKFDSATIATAQAYSRSVIPRLDESRLFIVFKFLRNLEIMSKIDFSELDLSDLALPRIDLSRANLSRANLSRVKLEQANLEFSNLKRANLKEAKLGRAKLNGANLKYANLNRTSLYITELKNANLDFANMKKAYCLCANLNGASLLDANLEKAHLYGVQLKEASMVFTNLNETDLSKAKMEGANLNLAYLRQAKLVEADLRGTNLSGANLEEANLEEANLSGAHLEEANLNGVIYNEKTIWPDDFDKSELEN